ncbi:hypothetical protein LguiA_013441 [Lonicera macranthoides]
MSFTLRSVKVPPNSVNLEEARKRTFDFFRAACRSIPTIMDIYNLDDVVNPAQLRTTIASQIRKNAHITNPKLDDNFRLCSFPPPFVCSFSSFPQNLVLRYDAIVIDMLLFKGMEELNNITEHAKQRHHIIGQYVTGQYGHHVQDLGTKDHGNSEFLKNFYNTNYF